MWSGGGVVSWAEMLLGLAGGLYIYAVSLCVWRVVKFLVVTAWGLLACAYEWVGGRVGGWFVAGCFSAFGVGRRQFSGLRAGTGASRPPCC